MGHVVALGEESLGEVYPLVAKRCIAELRMLETNAELNDADPTEVWRHLS